MVGRNRERKMPDTDETGAIGLPAGPVDVDAVRALFRRLHGEPMQAVATAAILLAAWERAVESGDAQAAASGARLLGEQIRSIGSSLQAIERAGLAILNSPRTAR
jgi:hypothetical protein